MANEIEDYQQATRTYEGAQLACERLVGTVHAASRALQKWRTATVSNASVGFPAHLVLGGGGTSSIDASQWPTAQELANALSAYHATQILMKQAFDRIPETQRAVIKPPTL
jgi:hypothetical protein